ncbi:aminopeptidase N [Pimelobacter simplex]|uniref:Aminopeptidase N n=1 Tax=Nocardioides simplex TaxID=2045 RepID=A0A0A1DQA9_NOCSI|nr:aminopeptidase N [Pimelobacter simplex]AIY17555.1 Membrane alanine aminopeptidase N [Pimelobacter simplex]MCG8149963.1 aminopeptidase N [Pimelobacter simplex]GEB13828.1 aminopeptidase [Pimelobacter simplex]SFM67815.1 Membrane alanyl aminopeptidase Metallo peptidase. MEROPS family M01 [Pimelobacter simplex]
MSLTRAEAEHRASVLAVSSYDVDLDLTGADDVFTSLTTIRFRCETSTTTFVDVKPTALHAVRLDGAPLDTGLLADGRVPLDLSAGDHELVVEATMAYRHDGEGLHRSVDPADGRAYVYGMSFMDAAPSVFACFDQPDLKAPYTMRITAPADWLVVGNAPAREVGGEGASKRWELGPTQPLATYFVTVVAGPYHLIRDEHDGIPLGLSSRQSLAATLDREADELLTLTRQSFDELHRLFGIRYPFGDYHQAFVPEFNAGAMENPGCITIRDPLLFETSATRADRSFRANLIAHEMAHQWFGNIVTPAWWDDLWLNESFAEYMGLRVITDATEYADAPVHDSYARRTWGITADQRPTTHPVAGNAAPDALSALQNFDGISYARGANVLRQLAIRLGDDAFLGGVREHFELHRFGNATMHDLFASWERAAGGATLDGFVKDWLLTPGADRLDLDRGAGVVRRTSPPAHPADRTHQLQVAVHGPEGWTQQPLVVDAPTTPLAVGDAAVLLDATETTWAVCPPDAVTMAALPTLARELTDPRLRATMWNSVRLGLFEGAVTLPQVADLLAAAPPVEDTSDGARNLLPWVLETVLPLAPDGTTGRFHAAVRSAAEAAPEGSELQLSAFRATVLSAGDAADLERWAAGEALPPGIAADSDLRWKALRRLAEIGATDQGALDEALAAEPTGAAKVHHARAVASLPATEAKEFAWARATGEIPVPNYEVKAAGAGLWRADQRALTEHYARAYFDQLDTLVAAHQGWVQGDVIEAFFPITHLDDATEAAALAALDGDLPGAVRRRLTDRLDELRRRRAVLA